jgi:hypothetical protein
MELAEDALRHAEPFRTPDPPALCPRKVGTCHGRVIQMLAIGGAVAASPVLGSP